MDDGPEQLRDSGYFLRQVVPSAGKTGTAKILCLSRLGFTLLDCSATWQREGLRRGKLEAGLQSFHGLSSFYHDSVMTA